MTDWHDTKIRIITVNFYDAYQGSDRPKGSQATADIRTIRTKENKEDKETDLRSDFTQDELEKLEKEGWTLT